MDSLLKYMGSKYPQDSHNRQEQAKYPQAPHKSLSFREKKTTAGWLGRQLSRQMSRGGNEFSDAGIERVAAVAAAVYAIRSVQDSEMGRRIKNDERPKTVSFPQFTNLKEETRPSTQPRTPERRRFIDFPRHGEESPETAERNVAVISDQPKPIPEPRAKITDTSGRPYFKDTIFSGNKPADNSGGGRTEPQKPVSLQLPTPPTPPVSRKPFLEPTNNTKKPGPVQSTRPSDPRETKADLWEKTEMAKIKDKYKKVEETISYWESKKKEKAMRKLEESQAIGVKRRKRERGRKKFEEDMEFIKQIAGEARAKADAKRRNDILKANQKADIIMQTGDLPLNCYCC